MYTKFSKSIGKKLIIATILPLFLVAVSLWTYSYTTPLLESEWKQDMELLLSLSKERLLAIVKQLEATVMITKNASVVEQFARDECSREEIRDCQTFKNLRLSLSRVKKSNPNIADMWLADPQKSIVVYDDGHIETNLSILDTEWHTPIEDPDTPSISGARLLERSDLMRFSVAQKVVHSGFGVYLGVDVPVQVLDSNKYQLRLQRKSELILLDEQGKFLAGTPSNFTELLAESTSVGLNLLQNSGLNEWKEVDLPGLPDSYVYAEPIPDIKWRLVVIVNKSAMNAPSATLLVKTIIMVTMALACCVLLGIININVKQQYQALSYREKLLATVFANMPVALMVRDSKHIAKLTNPEYMRVMELDENQIIGKSLDELPYQGMGKALRGMYDNKSNWHKYEFSTIISGQEKNMVSSVHSIKGEHDEDLFVAILQDITQSKKDRAGLVAALEKAEKAQAAAEKASSAQSEFLARMSHEIRTPMNAIIGLGNILLRTKTTTQQYNYLVKLRNAASNLLFLLNEVLDFSKIEAGKLEINPTVFEPATVLKDLADLVGYISAEKPLDFMFKVSPDLPDKLVGDPERISQILINLTNNAIKFTEKGKISISIHVEPEDEHHYMLKLSVGDTGIGISEDLLPTLFSPFVQADGTITRKYGGTGLGLTICKRLAELMQGSITVESTLGKGSVFHVNLLVGKEPGAAPILSRLVDSKKCSAYIVDSDHESLEIISGYFKTMGFDVSGSMSGKEALNDIQTSMANSRPFNLVSVDYKTSDINAIDFITQLKNMLASAAIVVTIAESDLDSGQESLAGLIDGYATKPMMPNLLKESVNNIIERYKSKDTPQTDDAIIPEKATDMPVLDKAKILLVEDNDINLEIAAELLSQAGAEITSAENGVEAVDLANAMDFDLIIMDMQMPVMDGLEATRRIRASGKPGLDSIPIIAMTANAMDEDKKACLNSGMNDFISKPFNIEDMLQTLSHWLKQAKK